MPLEFTPVDLCSHFIVKLLSISKYNLNIYHLFNNNFISTKNFVDTLQKLNIDIKFVSMDMFKKALGNNINNNYFGITNYIENVSNNVILNNTFTNSVIKKINLEWPEINDNYLLKIIQYLKTNELIGDENEGK